MTPAAPILICFDGSDDATVAIARAGALFPGREALVLAVWQRAHATSTYVTPVYTYAAELSSEELAQLDETAENAAAGLAADGCERARAAGLRPRPLHAGAAGPIAETMLTIAAEHRVAAVVVGSRGRGGIKSALLGSVSNHLVHHTTLPTLVVRHSAPEPRDAAPAALLYDGSDDASRAIELAAGLLGHRPAIVLTAWQTASSVAAVSWGGTAYLPDCEHLDRAAEHAAAEVAREGCALARRGGLAAEPCVVRSTSAVWPALVGAAEDADVAAIVVGSRGLRGAQTVLLGSVSASVTHHTQRPVLLVPR